MKKIIVASVLTLLMAAPVFAGDASYPKHLFSDGQRQKQTQQSESTAVSGSTNLGQGNGNTIIFPETPSETTANINHSGSQTVKNVPSVSGPNLTTSNDTCMGSTSGSVNIAGVGVGGGSTWTDDNCKRLKNSRELWNMGMRAAALALMCMDDENRMALEVTGFACPELKEKVSVEEKRSATVNRQLYANP